MSKWQPIETAPKDGTTLLLGRFVQKCEHGREGFMAVDYWVLPKHRRTFVGWGKFSTAWPPTHWMPLPAPPAESLK